MRPRVIPDLPPTPKYRRTGTESARTTGARGLTILNSPTLNKGMAFTAEERRALGLTGLLPAEISTIQTQVKSAYVQYERLPDNLSKNNYLTALHDRNEVLFFRLLSEHLREMIPIVNDLTVGLAMEQYHHESRRPRGVYLSIDHPNAIVEAFTNLELASGGVDLILATDAEDILGIGDWGVGGIEVSIGKLAIHTAAGGIDPGRSIPVILDVGTNRTSLLKDPMYVGNRHPRIRGARYDEFIEAYVQAVSSLFPHALLQWEGFAPAIGRRLLEKYRNRISIFNDSIQGTGAMTLGAAISALRVCGTPWRSQRVVIFGAGTAGMGIADHIRDAMIRDGLSSAEAAGRFWCIDLQGLLTTGMGGELLEFQVPYARPDTECKHWKTEAGGIRLAEVIHRVKPTMLIGSSGEAGAFTEAIIRDMAAQTPRPIVFVLSTPAAHSEATPADIITWTDGRALIATGSAFGPVTHKGVTYVVAQANNAMLFPGLVLGSIVARASRVSEGMLAAASNALSNLVVVRQQGAPLLPHLDDLRSVSTTVAIAVADAAKVEGLAGVKLGDIVQQVRDAQWQPEYSPLRAAANG